MKKEYQDIFIVDSEGIIIYIDVSNAKTLELPPEQLIGRKVSEIYKNVGEETSTLMKAVKTGQSTVDYEQELITSRNSKIIQISSTYPIMDGEKIVGAIELSEFKYRLDSIEYINSHWDRPTYRKNNTRYTIDDIISQNDEIAKIKNVIERVSKTDSVILITGETGTGKVPEEILTLFYRYSWPENIRELRNVIEGIFNLCETDEITADCLPRHICSIEQKQENSTNVPANLKQVLKAYEKKNLAKEAKIFYNVL